MKHILILLLCLFTFPIYGQYPYVYFINSKLPQLDFDIVGHYDNQDYITHSGRVFLENTTVKDNFSTVDLLLIMDNVLYKTEYSGFAYEDDMVTIRYPKHVYDNKRIKKILKIARFGYETALIDIEDCCKSDTFEIALKKQLATYPSIKVEKNNYYVDLSTMVNNNERLPYIDVYYTHLYDEICKILSQDSSWRHLNKFSIMLEFDEKGDLKNVNADIHNKNLIDFFNQQKWKPARARSGVRIPLNISLTIYNKSK